MNPLLTRYLRGAVLGMMLLLSGMASMVCFSYDADGDESTPPVTVEFNGVVPSKKGIQVSSPRSTAVAHHVRDAQPASVELLASVNFSVVPALDKGSPQLVVPLRR
ncbi:MAG TPA: hypothetical protein VGJ30_02675 [Candidatus Angelobacter sp.]|jgi:hypothetical protein